MKTLGKMLFAIIAICSVASALFYLYQNNISKTKPSNSDEEAQKESHKPSSTSQNTHYTTLNLYQ